MTKSPISTISYNTEEFLKSRLEEWYECHWIQAYMYIKHKGEDGDKDHIHLRIIPNMRLDPMDLSLELREYEPGNDKPLGVRPWQNSKEEDWILYAVHDKDYLRIKYGKKEDKREKLPYKWEDIVVSDMFDIEIAYIRARQYLDNTSASIIKQIKDGKSARQLIEEGSDVYRTNACMRALQITDMEKTISKLNELDNELNLIKFALINSHLELKKVYVEDSNDFFYQIVGMS